MTPGRTPQIDVRAEAAHAPAFAVNRNGRSPRKQQAIASRPFPYLHQIIDFVLVLASCVIFVVVNAVLKDATLDGSLLAGTVKWFYQSGTAGFLSLYAFLIVVLGRVSHLYEPFPRESLLDELFRLWKAIAVATLCLMAFLYVSHSVLVSRGLILFTGGVGGVLMSVHRFAARKRMEQALEAGKGLRNVLIVGAGDVGKALATLLEKQKTLGYSFKGFLDNRRSADPRILGDLCDLESVAKANFIDDVFITIPSERTLVKQLTLEAPRLRLNVNVIPEMFDGLGWQAPMSYVGDFPIMSLHREEERRLELVAKRFVDIVFSLAALITLAPFLLIVAAVIKLDSPGPVLFRPKRVGRKGAVFTCYKFRTMVADAHLRITELRHLNERKGLLFKMANDPRVTRIGRLLRKYSIDEVPQLFNILIGEMSLVGPRPPEISEYEQYQTGHLRRLEVPPGLTGLWQITARQDPSFESYLRLDLQYIENWSFWLDLKIIFRTIPAVLRGTGQ